MQMPLTFWDVSIILALAAIVLMITTELSSPRYGHTNLLINKERLRNAALAIGTAFIITLAVRVYTIVVA